MGPIAAAIGTLLGLTAFTSLADATTWLPPLRPLTLDEKVEAAVSGSHAIGIGRFLAVYDSLDRDGMAWRWMVFEPQRWLKGNGGVSSIRVYFSWITSTGTRKVSTWPSRTSCIVFLRRVAEKWVLIEAPYMGGGAVQIAPSPESVNEAAVARAIKRQTLGALARRSALIVIGKTVQRGDTCHAHGKAVKCAAVVVDSVVVGTLPAGSIRVHTLFGGFDSYAHVLLMLRPDGSGSYEPVGFGSGTLPITGDRVESLGASVRELVGRIRLAASGRR